MLDADVSASALGSSLSWPPDAHTVASRVAAFVAEGGDLGGGRDDGPVGALERGFAELAAQRFALSFNSGTSALLAALAGVGVGPGSEVVVPTHVFHAAASPILVLGATPVLCDVEEDTHNADNALILAALTPATTAVVVVHNWGHPCDIEPLAEELRRRGIALIEDCSHAHGASFRGRPVGSFGTAAIFSLHANKLVPAGEGGMLVTSSADVLRRAMVQGHYRGRAHQALRGSDLEDLAETGWGMKLRMHPLAAVVALTHLERLDSMITQRQTIRHYVVEVFSDVPGIDVVPQADYVSRHAHYGCRAHFRPEEVGGASLGRFVSACRQRGLDIHASTFMPLHRLGLFADPELRAPHATRTRVPTTFPTSDRLSRTTLSLPNFCRSDFAEATETYADTVTAVTKELRQR